MDTMETREPPLEWCLRFLYWITEPMDNLSILAKTIPLRLYRAPHRWNDGIITLGESRSTIISSLWALPRSVALSGSTLLHPMGAHSGRFFQWKFGQMSQDNGNAFPQPINQTQQPLKHLSTPFPHGNWKKSSKWCICHTMPSLLCGVRAVSDGSVWDEDQGAYDLAISNDKG